MGTSKKAILVVSFGTSSKETGISAIEQLESRIRDAYPSCDVYRAWTSSRIRKKLQEQENLKINSVSEALEQIKYDGIRNVVIQPTFVVDGEENRRLKKEALAYTGDFLSMEFGAPLLGDADDAKAVAMAISMEAETLFSYTEDDLVVFMGHGATPDNSVQDTNPLKAAANRYNFDSPPKHPEFGINAMYALVDNFLQQSGHSNMVLRLMNDPGSIEEILALASSLQPRRIILVPFMIVAGRHVQKDMAGEQETSWASRLTGAGYSVQCVMKGLGEYDTVQEIFIEHIKRIL